MMSIVIVYANDCLKENFDGVKDFEDKVGQAVVSEKNNLSSEVGDFIAELFMTRESIIVKGELFKLSFDEKI